MAAALEGENDAVFLNRGNAAEQVGCFETCSQRLVAEHFLRRPFRHQKPPVLMLNQHRNPAPFKIERHLIDLSPAWPARGSGIEDRCIKRASRAALEVAVEPSPFKHPLTLDP